MANIAILHSNLWSLPAAAVSATSSATGLPVTATQNPDRTYLWRSSPTTAEVMLQIDLGSAQSVSYAFLANVRRLNSSAITIEDGGSSASPGAWTNRGTLSATDPGTRIAAVKLTGAPISARHWRFRFATTGAQDYCEVGYAGLGPGFVPAVNMSEPMDLQLVDPAQLLESPDGQRSAAPRSLYWAGSFQFYKTSDSDRGTFETLYRSFGTRVPFFAWLDQATGWQALLMRLDNQIRVREELASPLLFTIEMDWSEER